MTLYLDFAARKPIGRIRSAAAGLALGTVLLMGAAALSGCSRHDDVLIGGLSADGEPAGAQMKMAESRAQASVPAASPAGDAPSNSSKAPNPFGSLSASQPDRYLIKNATVTLETGDPRKATGSLLASVKAVNGYVAAMHETVDGDGMHTVSITVRVPAQLFEGSMQEIESLGKLLDKEITAEDVTEEYVDSSARLRNLQRTEGRLLSHLSGTARLSDTLLVEKELNRVRDEIEQIEGRLRYLSHRVAYSTITITLEEAARPHAITPPEEYSSGAVASNALRSLVGYARDVWSGLIWIAVWAIVWLPVAMLIRYLYRRYRQRRVR